MASLFILLVYIVSRARKPLESVIKQFLLCLLTFYWCRRASAVSFHFWFCGCLWFQFQFQFLFWYRYFYPFDEVLFVLLLPLSDTPRLSMGKMVEGLPWGPWSAASVVLTRQALNEWRNDLETRGKHLWMGIMWCTLFIYLMLFDDLKESC